MAESKSYKPSSKYAKIFEGGSLYLRKDGYLIFQKYETDENDKYRRVTFTGKTEEQVVKKYKEFVKRAKEIRGQRQQEAYRMLAGAPLGLKPPAGIDIDISLSDWVLYFIQTYKTPPSVKRTNLFFLYADLPDPDPALLRPDAAEQGDRCRYADLSQLSANQRAAGQEGRAFPEKHLQYLRGAECCFGESQRENHH